MSALRSVHQISHAHSEERSSGRDGEDDSVEPTLDSSHETIEVPYHGSCPRCHHLHTNKLLRLSLNRFKHVRCRCDECDHQMFGIGRTSTQTTLASEESIPSSQRSHRNSSALRSSCRPICVAAPAVEVQTTPPSNPENLAPPAPLSIIDETHTSQGRSRSTSNLQSPDDASARPEGPTTASPIREKETLIVRQDPLPKPTELPRPPQGRRNLFSRLKEKLLHRGAHNKSHGSKKKEWEVFGRKISISRIATHRDTDGVEASYNQLPQRAMVESPELVQKGNIPPAGIEPGASLAQSPLPAETQGMASFHVNISPDPTARTLDSTPRGTSARDPGSTTTSPDFTARESEAGVNASQPGEPDDISSSSTSAGPQNTGQGALKTKHDRIHAWRRDQTLRREIAVRPVCHCHPGCPCHGGNRASGSDIASEIGETRTSSLELPDHPLGPAMASAAGSVGQSLPPSPRALHLTAIGVHFGFHRRPATSSISLHSHRLSQATTVHSNSSSSLSLTNGRPYPRRPRRRPSGSRARSGPYEAIQRYDHSHGHHPSWTVSDQGTDSERASRSSEETMADVPGAPDGPPPRAPGRSASLSVLTTNIPAADGSHASGSEDATPRPRSRNELSERPWTSPQPEPGALSSALQNIASPNHSGAE